MIKFFQKLKAKKGFTLVELIVVIAIIGVLAAILVPTMLGYVTNSRVTSADSTAASLANEIDNFFTEADTNTYGMKRANAAAVFQFTITTGTWAAQMTDYGANPGDSFNSNNGIVWTAAGGGNAASAVTSSSAKSAASGSGTALLTITLANLFPDIQSGYVEAFVSGGHCVAIAYTADANNVSALGTVAIGGIYSEITGNELTTTAIQRKTNAWDGHTAGVAGSGNGSWSGLIVGTSPKLSMSVS